MTIGPWSDLITADDVLALTIGRWSDLVVADNDVPLDVGPILGPWSRMKTVDSSVVLPVIIEPWSRLVTATWPATPRRVFIDGTWRNIRQIDP